VRPNTVLLNCLLGGCARAAPAGGVAAVDRGLGLIAAMRAHGVRPDPTSFNTLVAAAAAAAAGGGLGQRRPAAAAAVMKGLEVRPRSPGRARPAALSRPRSRPR
jgi:hypothetical protein